MTTWVITLLAIVLFMGALGIGALAGRGPIRGSCGGIAGSGCAACKATGRCRRTSNEDGS